MTKKTALGTISNEKTYGEMAAYFFGSERAVTDTVTRLRAAVECLRILTRQKADTARTDDADACAGIDWDFLYDLTEQAREDLKNLHSFSLEFWPYPVSEDAPGAGRVQQHPAGGAR